MNHCFSNFGQVYSGFFSFFQYLTNIDESPAKLGGKENYWRKLTLDGRWDLRLIGLKPTNYLKFTRH